MTFQNHVGSVLGLSADPKMAESWTGNAIDDVDVGVVVLGAGRVIAGVTGVHSGGNGDTGGDLQSESVGSIRNRLAVSTEIEVGVAIPICLAIPSPATILLNSAAPVLDDRIELHAGIPAANGAEPTFAPLRLPLRQQGFDATVLAGKRDAGGFSECRSVPLSLTDKAAGDSRCRQMGLDGERLRAVGADQGNTRMAGCAETRFAAELRAAILDRVEFGEEVDSALRADTWDGTLLGHRLTPTGGVMPPADLAIGAGVSCVNYTTTRSGTVPTNITLGPA